MNARQRKKKQIGYLLGFRWRNGLAKKRELSRLEDLWQSLDNQGAYGWDWYFTDHGSAFTPGERLFFELHREKDEDRIAASRFWRRLGTPDDGDFVQGFAEGALGFEPEVEPQRSRFDSIPVTRQR